MNKLVFIDELGVAFKVIERNVCPPMYEMLDSKTMRRTRYERIGYVVINKWKGKLIATYRQV